MDDDDVRPACNPYYGCEIVKGIELDRVQAGIDRVGRGDDRQRVAVGRRLHAVLVAYGAAAPRAVFHDDLLPDELGQPLRHEARDEIGAASGRAGDDNPHRLRRIRLRARARDQRAAKKEGGSGKAEGGRRKKTSALQILFAFRLSTSVLMVLSAFRLPPSAF